MISTYPAEGDVAQATWIDLLDATASERDEVERVRQVRIPTRASLEEIEATSRAFSEKGALYLSTSLPTRDAGGVSTEHVHEGSGVTSVGFVLTKELLLTVRFAPMPSFDLIADKARKEAHENAAPWDILLCILEKTVDLTADRLEAIAAGLADVSHASFRADQLDARGVARRRRSPAVVSRALRRGLRRLGTTGDLLWEVRDSLVGMTRIAHRLAEPHSAPLMGEGQPRLEPIVVDLKSLADTREQLSSKVQFLLDATLGFINIEQNDIVQTLTVASVAGIPPVLVAGIYGMNFQHMPELSWRFGYPMALALLVVSGIVPVVWFKARGWM